MTAGRALVLAVLLGASGAASAGLVEIGWNGADRYEQRLSIEAGGFTELCGRLVEGARIQWQFEASAPTSFNIHFHEGKAVTFPAKEEGTTRSTGTLEVRSARDYCWMWSNKTEASMSVFVQMSKNP